METIKEKIKLIVLIPVGPTCELKNLIDTLDSINFYCTTDKKIIIINDSEKEINVNLTKYNALVLSNKKNMGKEYGLFYSLCNGLKYSVENFNFKLLLRIDTDALITGKKPEDDALKYFNLHKRTSMIGSYRVNPFGEKRILKHARQTILWETSTIGRIIDKYFFKRVNNYSKFVERARQKGYELGEHVLGGAVYYSYEFVDSLNTNNYLPLQEFKGTRLQEDFIFGILSYDLNFNMRDFVTNDYPMFLAWRGLASSPDYIIKHRKKIIHSVRFYKDLNESEIREYFKKHRNKLYE